jgi:hypothetical protein
MPIFCSITKLSISYIFLPQGKITIEICNKTSENRPYVKSQSKNRFTIQFDHVCSHDFKLADFVFPLLTLRSREKYLQRT